MASAEDAVKLTMTAEAPALEASDQAQEAEVDLAPAVEAVSAGRSSPAALPESLSRNSEAAAAAASAQGRLRRRKAACRWEAAAAWAARTVQR